VPEQRAEFEVWARGIFRRVHRPKEGHKAHDQAQGHTSAPERRELKHFM
jgi:hypothetical protein